MALSRPTPEEALLADNPAFIRTHIADYPSHLYAVVPLRTTHSSLRQIRVATTLRQGRILVHIREWYIPWRAPENGWLPGRGVAFEPIFDAFTGELFPTLDVMIAALQEIRDDLASGQIPEAIGRIPTEPSEQRNDHLPPPTVSREVPQKFVTIDSLRQMGKLDELRPASAP